MFWCCYCTYITLPIAFTIDTTANHVKYRDIWRNPSDLDNVYFIFFAVWVGLLASVFAWTFAKWNRFRYLYSKKHRWLPLIIVSFCYSCTRIHKHRKHTYIPNYLTSLHINLLAIPCEMESLIPCFFSLFAILESECRLLILCLPFFFLFSIEFSYSFWFSNKFYGNKF